VPVLIADISELLDVGGHLRLQRRRQHLPGTVPDQLIQQRHRLLRLLRSRLTNYREHRRTFPTSVGALALLEDLYRDYREGTSSPPLPIGETLTSADPQVSSIALEHGLIRSKNGRLRAVPWTQVRELRLWRAGGAIAGTLLAYYVVTTDRKLIGIAAKVKHGRDEFGDHLQRLVSAVGAPVVEGGPALGERRVRR